MDTELQKQYDKAIAFLEIRKRGEVGDIPPDEIDEHLEKNASEYAFWGAKLAEMECALQEVEDEYDSWLYRKLKSAKDSLKDGSKSVTEKDCMGEVLNNIDDNRKYEEYKSMIRFFQKDCKTLKTIVKAYDLRGFHLMNLANRMSRGYNSMDSSRGRVEKDAEKRIDPMGKR